MAQNISLGKSSIQVSYGSESFAVLDLAGDGFVPSPSESPLGDIVLGLDGSAVVKQLIDGIKCAIAITVLTRGESYENFRNLIQSYKAEGIVSTISATSLANSVPETTIYSSCVPTTTTWGVPYTPSDSGDSTFTFNFIGIVR